MAYVNEKISDEDKIRINFEELKDESSWRPRPSGWTVDRATGNFLINTFWGDADDRNAKRYFFCWNGKVLRVDADTFEKKESGVLVYVWTMTGIQKLPSEIEAQRDELYSDLCRAIKCDVLERFDFYKHIEFNLIGK